MRLLGVAAALLTIAASGRGASANWITIRNETGKTIVVQESVVVNGQVRRGKAKNLLAGETLREFVPAPTVKRVEVFEAAQPNQAAWSGNLNCKDENQVFSVANSGGKVVVSPVTGVAKK